jgi:hypothetical protein
VPVVMGDEALRLGWRDIGIDLCREVQFDLDGLRQRGNRAHVLLNVIQHDRVAVGKVASDAGQIETAISKPVIIGAFFVVLFGQAHPRRLRSKQL